jgi:hypothetical protein
LGRRLTHSDAIGSCRVRFMWCGEVLVHLVMTLKYDGTWVLVRLRYCPLLQCLE